MRLDRMAFSLLAVVLLLGLAACAGTGNEKDFLRAPELLSLEMAPNPVDAGEDTTFIVTWEDQEGDMAHPTVTLKIENEDDETLLVPVEDIVVDGTETAGSLLFVIAPRVEYQGKCIVTVTDDSGNTSEEIEEYLYVNPLPGTAE